MKTLVILMFTAILIFAITPEKTFRVQGNVVSVFVDQGFIYAATDQGRVEIFRIEDGSKEREIVLENISNYFDEVFPPKVFNVDMLDQKMLILSEGVGGTRNVFILQDGKLNQVIGEKDRLSIKLAKWVDSGHILLGLMSNEAILFNVEKKTARYRAQYSPSTFSHFAFDAQRTTAAWTCESGIVYIIDVQSGKVLKEIKGANKDNVYKVDFENGKVLTAGQDRLAALYDVKSGSFDTYQGSFLIYAVGLDSTASLAAVALNEKSEIAIINTETKQTLAWLKGHKSIINSIIFLNQKEIVTGSDDPSIYYWRLP